MSIRLGLGLGLQYSCRGRCGGSQESATIEAYDSNENLIDPVVHEDGTKFWVFTDDSGTIHVTGNPEVDILLVGGGGGGGTTTIGGYSGGGGGGGRVVEVVGAELTAEAYTIVRGAGGIEHTNGGSSRLYEGMGEDKTLVYNANGGGGGGNFPPGFDAKNGGSGGGGTGKSSTGSPPNPGGNAVPPSTEPHGYGNDGGAGAHNRAGGGGGGAGGPGGDSISDLGLGGPGGPGMAFPRFAGVVEGNPTGLFAGGGRGGTRSSNIPPNGEGTHGYGGGGNYTTTPMEGRPGGDGIVIIRMEAAK